MKITGNNFAVIGGAGFIGSYICEELCKRHAKKIVVVDNFSRGKLSNLKFERGDTTFIIERGDILDKLMLSLLFERHEIKGVFHLAASWLNECYENPRKCIENNIIGTFNVLEACKDFGIERLVFSSSASVYGDQIKLGPIQEDAPYLNKNLYGATKIAGEHLLQSFHHQYGLSCVALRYMNVYGPRMDTLGTYVGLIPKVLNNIDNREPVVIAGNGEQLFDFVYVTDVVEANILMMGWDYFRDYLKDYDTFYFVNVGSGVGHSVNFIVDTLVDIYGEPADIVHDESLVKPGAVTRRIGSTEKAEALGFKAQVLILEGLKRVVKWHREKK